MEMLAPVEDVEAPVPEAELDEREARRLGVPVRGLGVDPDLRLLRDPRREDGEVLRRLVDPVVQARRGLDVAHKEGLRLAAFRTCRGRRRSYRLRQAALPFLLRTRPLAYNQPW